MSTKNALFKNLKFTENTQTYEAFKEAQDNILYCDIKVDGFIRNSYLLIFGKEIGDPEAFECYTYDEDSDSFSFEDDFYDYLMQSCRPCSDKNILLKFAKKLNCKLVKVDNINDLPEMSVADFENKYLKKEAVKESISKDTEMALNHLDRELHTTTVDLAVIKDRVKNLKATLTEAYVLKDKKKGDYLKGVENNHLVHTDDPKEAMSWPTKDNADSNCVRYGDWQWEVEKLDESKMKESLLEQYGVFTFSNRVDFKKRGKTLLRDNAYLTFESFGRSNLFKDFTNATNGVFSNSDDIVVLAKTIPNTEEFKPVFIKNPNRHWERLDESKMKEAVEDLYAVYTSNPYDCDLVGIWNKGLAEKVKDVYYDYLQKDNPHHINVYVAPVESILNRDPSKDKFGLIYTVKQAIDNNRINKLLDYTISPEYEGIIASQQILGLDESKMTESSDSILPEEAYELGDDAGNMVSDFENNIREPEEYSEVKIDLPEGLELPFDIKDYKNPKYGKVFYKGKHVGDLVHTDDFKVGGPHHISFEYFRPVSKEILDFIGDMLMIHTVDISKIYHPVKESKMKESYLQPVPKDYKVIETPAFLKDVKHLGFTKKDIAELKLAITERAPRSCLGSCLYKFDFWPKRFNLSSSEGRVIYYCLNDDKTVSLIRAYHKNEIKDLTQKEKNNLRKAF